MRNITQTTSLTRAVNRSAINYRQPQQQPTSPMGLTMVNHRQVSESGDSHHPHHQQHGVGPAPHLIRPSSVVHQSHHGQAPSAPQQSAPPAYQSSHSYQEHSQPNGQAYYTQSSAYNPQANTGYSTNDPSTMIANNMQHRSQYPPMSSGIGSYHTPSSNSPASVPSPSGHDVPTRGNVYHSVGPTYQQPSMYPYSTHPNHYTNISPHQPAPTSYSQQGHQAQQPSMASQPSLMMSHSNAQQQHLTQQTSQHSQQGIVGSPRHAKIEPQHTITPQLQRATVPGPLGVGTPTQNSQNGTAMSTPSNASTGGVNPNAAPGPIPATTPLVVRQDQNGVQWIAFEYSRDRVKMEYTIRCDVESVHTDELTPEFKTENCVYPRACCSKENYRGNRLQYETECNTVGWALAQLNPPLRGKRGLIQRAVDSWRNSNQDPRLRSRRVRRMAKMNNRKNVAPSPHTPHMPGPNGQQPLPGSMGPGGTAAMGKAGMNGMGHMQQQHHQGHHDGSAQGGGDEVDETYEEDEKHHHHHVPAASQQPPNGGHGYEGYGSPEPPAYPGGASAVKAEKGANEEIKGLFPETSEAKKRKFILVEDTERHQRLRVRVALQGVDTGEIPDSFRKTSAVYQRSFFPREMQSEPTTPTGSRFFTDDPEDDGDVDTEARGARHCRRVKMATVPLPDGEYDKLPVPALTKYFRGKEVRLNDLAYRMAWLQSRVFNQRPIFLQRALDSYRNKTFTLVTSAQQDARTLTPHLETRVGKRKWNERLDRGSRRGDD